MRYEDKLRQADREARAALAGLAATIVVWTACGFGLAPSGIYVCATPLWVVAGCGGTFLFTVGVAVWMACHVMKDVGLDEADACESASGGGSQGVLGCARENSGENAPGGQPGSALDGARANAPASANARATSRATAPETNTKEGARP